MGKEPVVQCDGQTKKRKRCRKMTSHPPLCWIHLKAHKDMNGDLPYKPVHLTETAKDESPNMEQEIEESPEN